MMLMFNNDSMSLIILVLLMKEKIKAKRAKIKANLTIFDKTNPLHLSSLRSLSTGELISFCLI